MSYFRVPVTDDLELPTSHVVWHPELSVILTDDIGYGAVIHSHVWIGKHVRIGKRVRVQAFCFIPEGVTIGDDCFIGPRVTFTNDKHPPSVDWLETVVESNVSIGAGAIILPGITIGTGAVIGAGALVIHDVSPGAEVKGIW